MHSNSSLSLNRKLQNSDFESWKLGSNFVQSRSCVQLQGQVYQGASDAVDFMHTKAAVLRNHLIESQGRVFVATTGDEQAVVVHEVAPDIAGGDVQLTRVATIDMPASQHGPLACTAAEAALDCSLAVLAAPAEATPAMQAAADGSQAAAAAAAAAGGDEAGGGAAACSLILVSTGKGDLLLLQQLQDGSVVASAAVFPLRSRPPAVGVRPFVVEAAWRSTTGHIRCVLSALKTLDSSSSSSSRAPASQLRGVCEVWQVTLQAATAAAAAAVGSGSSQQQQAGVVLHVVSSQLLMVSKGPPAAAVAAAAAGAAGCVSSEALLLVGEPPLEEEELPAGYAEEQAASKPDNVQQQQQQSLRFVPEHQQSADAAGSAGPAAPSAIASAAGSAAAAAAAAAGGVAELDDMDVDPRTLQQAAARLAHYTSEEALGELPQQQWTDVFKESGPAELSDAELAVDVLLFTTAAAAGSNATESSSGPAAGSSQALQPLALASCVSCAPHRLLAVRALPPSSGRQGPAGLLLGCSDDVDCALVSAQLSAPTLPAAAAAATAAAAAGSSSAAGSAAGCWGVSLCHQASLPALAYVVSGKTQRRHLLLGDRWSPLCGVLVEGQKYAYLYGQPAAQQQHGQQQILDMELPAGSRILGARLMQRGAGSDTLAHDAAAPVADGSSSNTVRLLLLTSSELICYVIKAP